MGAGCGVHKLNKTGQNGTKIPLRFCKNILQVQRRAPNSACRAELGQYPLLLNIQKWAQHFWNYIKTSDPLSFSYRALCYHESNPQRTPLCLLALRLSKPPTTQIITPRPSQRQDKNAQHNKTQPNYDQRKRKIHYCTELIESQSKMKTYVALNRQYTVAAYLTTVSDTMYVWYWGEHWLSTDWVSAFTWHSRKPNYCVSPTITGFLRCIYTPFWLKSDFS